VFEIVGVAGNTKYLSLREKLRPVLYLPIAQDAEPRGSQLVIRSALPPAKVIPGVRRAIAEVDPGARFSFGEMKELVMGPWCASG